jgi:hypothetical protein
VFSRDGRYLYGSSYYTGVSNIFRYEVATGKMDAVSNAETGFFRPVPRSDGKLVVLTTPEKDSFPRSSIPPARGCQRDQFLGTEVVNKYPIVKTWQVPPPSTVDYEKEIIARGNYSALGSVTLDNAFPVLQGYKDAVGFGYHFNFADPLNLARLGITMAYTPARTRRAISRVTSTSRAAIWAGAASCTGTARISMTSSARPSAARRAMRPRPATTGCSSTTSRAGWRPSSTLRTTTRSIRCRMRRTWKPTSRA